MTVTDTPIATRAEQVEQAAWTRLPAHFNAAFAAEIDCSVARGGSVGVARPGPQMQQR